MNKRKKEEKKEIKERRKERKLIFNSFWIQQKIQLKWAKKEMFCCFIYQK